jgi:uncharacterized protein YbbK (DUF523 family)
MIRVGVSACLLGHAVRWDGRHKLEPALRGLAVEWVPVCPEVELGLGVPRPPLDIVGGALIESGTGRDLTAAMRGFAARRVAALGRLSGYVLKLRSPSCDPDRGLFAAALRAACPELPVAAEEELRDPAAGARFWERVAAHHSRGGSIQSP